MNILFLAAMEINPQMGGLQRVTDLLGSFFVSRGHSVVFLSACEGKPFITPAGIKHLFMPVVTASNLTGSRKILDTILADEKMDVLINQCGPSPEIADLLFTPVKPAVKVITVVHGSVILFIKGYRQAVERVYGKTILSGVLNFPPVRALVITRHRKKFSKVYRKIINNGDALVLLAEGLKEELKYYFKDFPGEKIHIIGNPSAYRATVPDRSQKEKIILFVGRLTIDPKRCDLLLKAWNLIFRQFPGWTLSLVGDGESKPQLIKYVEENGIERVNFHGYLEPEPFYRKAPVICLTSNHEGFPLALAEAMSFGLVPVVFNTFAAAGDIIEHKRSGFLVEKDDLRGYADALATLMKDRDLLLTMSGNALDKASHFSVEATGEKWIGLLSGLVKPVTQ
jgi:glycosyltransferase involved in cell wall biosynthesis